MKTRHCLCVAMALFMTPSKGVFANALQDQQMHEKKLVENGGIILPYRPTYFLPVAYNSNPNDEVFQGLNEAPLDHTEAKFQISFKSLLAKSLFRDSSQIYFAYTQLCLWQIYNKDFSSPFRDSNYEPEFFLNMDTAKPIGPMVNRAVQFGAVHQSNGRSDPLSRSWNRVYAQFILDYKDLVVALKPWYRIPESSEVDNNPDIAKYMGYGELRLAAKWKTQVFSAMIRNNLNLDHNKGALELGWSVPLGDFLKGYLQYFNGYGECLLDYNHYNNRIGIGIALTDWL